LQFPLNRETCVRLLRPAVAAIPTPAPSAFNQEAGAGIPEDNRLQLRCAFPGPTGGHSP
jgi:hypothetical protein